MRTEPRVSARKASRRSVDAIIPLMPGFRPRAGKRNVIVLLVYLLSLVSGVGLLRLLLSH